ncbi:acyltransferase family protein [Acinetobacter sp. A47]|uniref:acyltransferase family protein n=1 Tax=Acinetobacter sp. A47 TaxID=1561217 RepID=UPI000571B7B3|nr:acyltransferase family protein [Acinetobacter sp. A47]
MSVTNFRSDINGLRAYAVIFVVLFHFQITGFAAGFLGVDIFFVISGYLMTKIILENLQKQRFSLSDFYLARITRIFPALLFLVLVLTIIGWFIFIPEDYKRFAKDARYSLMFLSNNLYYAQAGDYFAIDAHEKALLHTWSLSVEWQFYLLFPVLLVLYYKLNKGLKHVGIFLGILCVASLGYCIYLTPKDTMYAFFKLLTRAWELIAGGLVYYYFKDVQLSSTLKKLSERAGFLLILGSLALLNQNTPWPGSAALLPVAGTMLILIANRQDSWFTRLTVIQNIGSASYSIYLWHWPVAFLLNYFFIPHQFFNLGLALILSFILGWLSYKYIESSRRFVQQWDKKKLYVLFFAIIAVAYFSYKYISQDGVQTRASHTYLASAEPIQMPSTSNGWCFYDLKTHPDLAVGTQGLSCYVGSKAPEAQKALLFGDSFAGHNSPFWDTIGKKLDLKVQTVSTNWCYPSLNDKFTGDRLSASYQQCLFNRNFLAHHMDQYDVLIFAGRWSDIVGQSQQQGFAELLAIAEQHHKKVIVMSEPYAFNKNISLLFKRALWLDRDFNLNNYLDNIKARQQVQATAIINDIVYKHKNTLLLTRSDLFTPDHMANRNTPYSLDGRHLSIIGSLESARYFEHQPKYQHLRQFVAQPALVKSP